ncbi:MAG: hypothetical protein JO170_27845 [Verrucomicrobia bacterium]|nr:hypothetical protein [Verrucomicrobiota bacterium]
MRGLWGFVERCLACEAEGERGERWVARHSGSGSLGWRTLRVEDEDEDDVEDEYDGVRGGLGYWLSGIRCAVSAAR